MELQTEIVLRKLFSMFHWSINSFLHFVKLTATIHSIFSSHFSGVLPLFTSTMAVTLAFPCLQRAINLLLIPLLIASSILNELRKEEKPHYHHGPELSIQFQQSHLVFCMTLLWSQSLSILQPIPPPCQPSFLLLEPIILTIFLCFPYIELDKSYLMRLKLNTF